MIFNRFSRSRLFFNHPSSGNLRRFFASLLRCNKRAGNISTFHQSRMNAVSKAGRQRKSEEVSGGNSDRLKLLGASLDDGKMLGTWGESSGGGDLSHSSHEA